MASASDLAALALSGQCRTISTITDQETNLLSVAKLGSAKEETKRPDYY